MSVPAILEKCHRARIWVSSKVVACSRSSSDVLEFMKVHQICWTMIKKAVKRVDFMCLMGRKMTSFVLKYVLVCDYIDYMSSDS